MEDTLDNIYYSLFATVLFTVSIALCSTAVGMIFLGISTIIISYNILSDDDHFVIKVLGIFSIYLLCALLLNTIGFYVTEHYGFSSPIYYFILK